MSLRLDFIYYMSNTVELSLATLKVALQNVLCVAQRGKLQKLLQYFYDKMNSDETFISYFESSFAECFVCSTKRKIAEITAILL